MLPAPEIKVDAPLAAFKVFRYLSSNAHYWYLRSLANGCYRDEKRDVKNDLKSTEGPRQRRKLTSAESVACRSSYSCMTPSRNSQEFSVHAAFEVYFPLG
jgi:hypothetical protein